MRARKPEEGGPDRSQVRAMAEFWNRYRLEAGMPEKRLRCYT
jgi:hypothetical protein